MSEFVYAGTGQNIPEFRFPSLYGFVQRTRGELQQPLVLPEYAVAGEEKPVGKVSGIIHDEPYKLRDTINIALEQFGQGFQPGSLRPVPYREYPTLYRAAQFTIQTEKKFADLDVLIQIYRAKSKGDLYQAQAISYLNKAWLFISEHLFMQSNTDMLQDEEVCFILGHELGHAQCRHTVIRLLANVELGSNVEYSADRAGMIVCAKRALQLHPEMDVRQALDRAVLYCVAALDKLGLAYQGYTNWKDYDYGALEAKLHTWLDDPGKLPADSATHPCDERRALALYHFSQSEMLWRLLGLAPEAGLLTDSQLQHFMNTLLKK